MSVQQPWISANNGPFATPSLGSVLHQDIIPKLCTLFERNIWPSGTPKTDPSPTSIPTAFTTVDHAYALMTAQQGYQTNSPWTYLITHYPTTCSQQNIDLYSKILNQLAPTLYSYAYADVGGQPVLIQETPTAPFIPMNLTPHHISS